VSHAASRVVQKGSTPKRSRRRVLAPLPVLRVRRLNAQPRWRTDRRVDRFPNVRMEAQCAARQLTTRRAGVVVGS